ncbi:MAG: Cd(II)/Pb(II)-responsive transcriptional regulator [Rhodospirillales bacterium]|nr:Cd(II)/Pb(II)-responsive transcriptional regulator [Rhodospirillales bacterium]
MQIGELAKRAACTLETIRFYEREGLLPRPERTGGNYRRYSAVDVDRLAFIRKCRSLGMPLAEIQALLGCRGRPDTDCRVVNALVDRQIARIAEQIGALKSLERQLIEIRQTCDERQNPEHRAGACGIIRSLGEAVNAMGAHGRQARNAASP